MNPEEINSRSSALAFANARRVPPFAETIYTLAHGELRPPVFLPDGTQGVVRSVDAADLLACQIQAVQMNVFHLMQRPGSSTIQALGGLHRMAGWSRPIFTDSGGFQVYSFIRQNPKNGSITDRGATFRIEGRRFNLTPEKSVQLQLSYGSDLVICFDDCTHPADPLSAQAESVRRTINWARRCRKTFDELIAQKELDDASQLPWLVAVIQGGTSRDLRRQCAESLLEIGFDGYGYGGWPLDSEGNLLADMLAYTRELVPQPYPLHALGVGHPANVAACVRMGYPLFDSTMPTRDARHGRLYVYTVNPTKISNFQDNDWFRYLYINDERHIKQSEPISRFCDCPCCQRYSLGYVHHLFKLNDSLYPRLATMHNLRFMTQLTAALRHT
jgi:queuine tRNA-ribosyltransferase